MRLLEGSREDPQPGPRRNRTGANHSNWRIGGTYLQRSSSGWSMGGVSLNASPRSHAREKMSVAMAMAGFLTLQPPPIMFSSETTAARGLSLVL